MTLLWIVLTTLRAVNGFLCRPRTSRRRLAPDVLRCAEPRRSTETQTLILDFSDDVVTVYVQGDGFEWETFDA